MRTQFAVYNGLAPKGGPKVIAVPLTLVAATPQTIDLLLENTNGELAFVQSVYIDNSLGADPLVIDVPVTGQKVSCPAFSQGTFPLYSIDQTQLVVQCVSNATAKLILCNFAQPYNTWSVV